MAAPVAPVSEDAAVELLVQIEQMMPKEELERVHYLFSAVVPEFYFNNELSICDWFFVLRSVPKFRNIALSLTALVVGDACDTAKHTALQECIGQHGSIKEPVVLPRLNLRILLVNVISQLWEPDAKDIRAFIDSLIRFGFQGAHRDRLLRSCKGLFKSAIHLCHLLEDDGKLDPKDCTLVRGVLRDIGRPDLITEYFEGYNPCAKVLMTVEELQPDAHQHFTAQSKFLSRSNSYHLKALKAFSDKEDVDLARFTQTIACRKPLILPREVEEIIAKILKNQNITNEETAHIYRSLSLIAPIGALKTKMHSNLYSQLFKMAWNGEDDKAQLYVKAIASNNQISVDLKIISMEVVHTVNSDRDLKMLTSALALTDRGECENKHILKVRLHRRIAGLHYRNGDIDDARTHLTTALQLSSQLAPDIDTTYTARLEALVLFEEFKANSSETSIRGAEKFFRKAMDHARQLPPWKKLITERIKVSKGLFHVDTIKHYREHGKSEEVIEQLIYRAEDTLEDVEVQYLTDGDRAFYYTTYAKFLLISNHNLDEAVDFAKQSISINHQCNFESRAEEAETLLHDIQAAKKTREAGVTI